MEGLCFCIDFRMLNTKTKKDSYPLPHIQETLDSFIGARVFLMLNLKSGFWQIMMDEESKQYTAFTVGNLGFFWLIGNEPMQSCSVCHVSLSLSLSSASSSVSSSSLALAYVYSPPSDRFDHRSFIS